MRYKLYLLHIGDLEDESLQDTAMALIDEYRQELVHKKKIAKDRMLAIAAGLLLQVGFLELEPDEQYCKRIELLSEEQPGQGVGAELSPEEQPGQLNRTEILAKRQPGQGIGTGSTSEGHSQQETGMCFQMKAKTLVQYLQESSNRYREAGFSVNSNFTDHAGIKQLSFPLPLIYTTGSQGKPYWDREALYSLFPQKKLWYFNVSHSGEYVALAIADREVGVDIQEPRKAERIPGGYRGFSRLESYVKCTGAGYAYGHREYENAGGNVAGYQIQALDLIADYALYVCMAEDS